MLGCKLLKLLVDLRGGRTERLARALTADAASRGQCIGVDVRSCATRAAALPYEAVGVPGTTATYGSRILGADHLTLREASQSNEVLIDNWVHLTFIGLCSGAQDLFTFMLRGDFGQ